MALFDISPVNTDLSISGLESGLELGLGFEQVLGQVLGKNPRPRKKSDKVWYQIKSGCIFYSR